MKLSEVKMFPQLRYSVDIPLGQLKSTIDKYIEEGVQLNPDFQRGRVWSHEQRVNYVEFMLRGGSTGNQIYFNHPHWMGTFEGEFVLVDGLQRILALLSFIEEDLLVFECETYSSLKDRFKNFVSLRFNVCCLQTKYEVIDWYLLMNEGGVVHTKEELDRVKSLREYYR